MDSAPKTLYHATPASVFPLIALNGLIPGPVSGLVYMAINPENALRYAMHRHASEEPTEFVILAIEAEGLDPMKLEKHLLPVRGEVKLNFKYSAAIAPGHVSECGRMIRTKPGYSETVEPLSEADVLAGRWPSRNEPNRS